MGTAQRKKKLSEGHSPEDRARAYEAWYRGGGWNLPPAQQLAFMRRVARSAAWGRGDRILELGCGEGLQASLMAKLGLDVTAVDASHTGIEHARRDYGTAEGAPRFVCADLEDWSPDDAPFDGIYCRGMSMYHYELNTVNHHGYDVPKQTRRFFEWLRPGGVFVLHIVTRFNGERPANFVHHSKLSEYKRLFGQFGKVVRVTDWSHTELRDDHHAEKHGKVGIVIYTRKPG